VTPRGLTQLTRCLDSISPAPPLFAEVTRLATGTGGDRRNYCTAAVNHLTLFDVKGDVLLAAQEPVTQFFYVKQDEALKGRACCRNRRKKPASSWRKTRAIASTP